MPARRGCTRCHGCASRSTVRIRRRDVEAVQRYMPRESARSARVGGLLSALVLPGEQARLAAGPEPCFAAPAVAPRARDAPARDRLRIDRDFINGAVARRARDAGAMTGLLQSRAVATRARTAALHPCASPEAPPAPPARPPGWPSGPCVSRRGATPS